MEACRPTCFLYYFKFNQIVNIPSTKTLNWQYVCYLLLLLLFILTHFNSFVTTRGLSVADFLYSKIPILLRLSVKESVDTMLFRKLVNEVCRPLLFRAMSSSNTSKVKQMKNDGKSNIVWVDLEVIFLCKSVCPCDF